jgi:hypothetical protein
VFVKSLGEPADPCVDRRHAERHRTVLRLAFLHTPRGREGCVVRNISSLGLGARVYRQIGVGVPVQAELCPGAMPGGRVVWACGWQIGIAFDEPVDVEHVLRTPWTAEGEGKSRLPRFDVAAPAQARVGATMLGVRILNISQGGARIALGADLKVGAEMVLKLPLLPPLPATVRWAGPGCAGICFHEQLAFEALAGWIAQQENLGLPAALSLGEIASARA